MLRNGLEQEAIVELVDDSEVVFCPNKKSPRMTFPLKDVYLIKFAKRGNVYITPEGQRVTGENHVIDKDADIVYLTDGAEIPAYNVKLTANNVSFLGSKPKNKKSIPIATTYPREKVFLIKYKDGTKDKITDITFKEAPAPAAAPAVEETAKDEGDDNVGEQVVFHSVEKGETLTSIAKKYGVKAADLIEWNDLPSKLRPNTRLQDDMQLMIYVKAK